MVRGMAAIACVVIGLLACQDNVSAQWPPDEMFERLPPLGAPIRPDIPFETSPEPVETPPPLESEELLVIEEEEPASWFLPSYWFDTLGWSGSAEVGLSGTDGNAETVSFRSGMKLKRKTEINEMTFDATYLRAMAEGTMTQHNALQNAGYEHFFGDSRWSLFAKEALEYDEFKAFDVRIAMNSGVAYQFIKTDTTKLKGRYGGGVSHEIGGPNDDWTPELIYGADFERQLTKRQKLTLKVDYFPEWGNFDNFRIVGDFAWEVLLDEEHNLNLKFSVNDRYDSTPNGRKANDVNYALLLMWKL